MARAAPAAAGDAETRDIEEVVAGEPAFDEAMIGFCRWVADYYQAPLGEVLRAALPQGEQASATRAVRLTAAGRQALERQPALLPDASRADPVLAALAAAGGELPLRRLERAVPRAPRASCPGWSTAGWSRWATRCRTGARRRRWRTRARRARRADTLPKRAAAKRAAGGKLAAAADGLLVSSLSAAERATLRALVAAGLARVEHRAVARAPEARAAVAPPGITLTPAQAHAVDTLIAALAGGFASFLLHGITGSGKTEVYLRVIAAARAAGRGALVLVPEIALTPQLAARFRARFGEDVAVLHSALPPRERLAAWRRLRAGEVGIALGARSAVFAPVRALGVVVVDEEHDPSFKQEEGVRYHGRDLAVVRAQRAGAIAILGLGDAVARERAQRRRAGASRAWCCPSARRRGRCPR